jgi:hypothetical protein
MADEHFSFYTEDWTGEPFYGTRGTFFADVTGDGRADAIAVNDDAVIVRRSMLGSGQGWFGPAEAWTAEPFFGTRGTFFVDIDADGRADAVAVNDGGVLVRRSNGERFGPVEEWTGRSFYGTQGTFFANVRGAGQLCIIAVNDDKIIVGTHVTGE